MRHYGPQCQDAAVTYLLSFAKAVISGVQASTPMQRLLHNSNQSPVPPRHFAELAPHANAQLEEVPLGRIAGKRSAHAFRTTRSNCRLPSLSSFTVRLIVRIECTKPQLMLSLLC